MKINQNFLGVGGMQNKKPSVGEYGYFLELDIAGIHIRSRSVIPEDSKVLRTRKITPKVVLNQNIFSYVLPVLQKVESNKHVFFGGVKLQGITGYM